MCAHGSWASSRATDQLRQERALPAAAPTHGRLPGGVEARAARAAAAAVRRPRLAAARFLPARLQDRHERQALRVAGRCASAVHRRGPPARRDGPHHRDAARGRPPPQRAVRTTPLRLVRLPPAAPPFLPRLVGRRFAVSAAFPAPPDPLTPTSTNHVRRLRCCCRPQAQGHAARTQGHARGGRGAGGRGGRRPRGRVRAADGGDGLFRDCLRGGRRAVPRRLPRTADPRPWRRRAEQRGARRAAALPPLRKPSEGTSG